MRIVVLTKPVPDPASGQERLGPDGRVDRAAAPAVVNGNDEYALEAALKLVEAAGEGDGHADNAHADNAHEIVLVAMTPANGRDALRKGLAMGAHRAIQVTDPALAGSDWLATVRVLEAVLRDLEYDLVLAGADTSDGGGGVVGAGVAARLGLPYLSYAATIEPSNGRVRVNRLTATGHEVLEAEMPALVTCTQALGAPRYPSLKGIMAARSKEIAVRALADLGIEPASVGAHAAGTAVLEVRPPAERGATRVLREPPDEAARELVAFLAERRLI
ncbi:MAG TPA: electron transfer flavoprotein subunit beta/FixA family protein [Candidatus Limnocylindrales bacterium]|nr:electron transfer flavoprotein subunit beta/FixA family protein [Candidatus Limnocylindrales bacterium]